MTTPDVDFVDLVVRAGDITADTPDDPDVDPNLLWIVSGTVTVTPMDRGGYRLADGTPVPYLAGVRTVRLTFTDTEDGYARNGSSELTYTRFVDLTGEQVNPRVEENRPTHRVEFQNLQTRDGDFVEIDAGNVRIAADTTEMLDDGTGTVRMVCNLARLLPLAASAGTPIFQGPKGVGVESVDQDAAADGDLVLNLTDGSSTTPVPLPPGVIPGDAQLATALGQPQAKGALSAHIAQDLETAGVVTATVTGDPSDPDVSLFLNGVEL